MSNEEQKFSDEFINAFVDDQLTPEEKAQVYARLSGNEALSRQICELRKTRDLVQLAYKEPPMPARGMSTLSAGRKIGLGVAAGLALVVIGGMVGWFLHQSRAPQDAAVAQVMSNSEEPTKVLFHVSDGNAEHLKTVLDEDFALGERMQRGFMSGLQEEVIYGRNEPALIHFHQRLRAALGVA